MTCSFRLRKTNGFITGQQFTVVESCRRRGIDPYSYLKNVLTRLPSLTNHQVPEIIPAAWAKARQPLRHLAS